MKFETSRQCTGVNRGSRHRRYLAIVLVVLSFGAWQLMRRIEHVRAQVHPPLYLASARQYETSYKGSDHAHGVIAGQPSALSMAAGDLDGDGITDLAVGFPAPEGGLIAIHHGNLDAFAPQSEKTFWAIARGDFPSPYLPQADLVEIPVRPDFLAEGDLIGLKGSALAAAALGGHTISVLSRDDAGVMQLQQTITVPGSITAMDVHDLARAKFASLVVGVHTDSGPRLLIYAGAHEGMSQTGDFPLSGDATSFASGNLDSEGKPALLVIAGGQISILHSASQTLEPLSTPFTVSRAAAGRFLNDRGSLFQMALLATDGSLHIMAPDNFDSTPYTVEEMKANRRARMLQRLARTHQKSAAVAGPVPPPAPRPAIAWHEVESSAGIGTPDSAGRTPLMFRTRVSNSGADDVMLMSPAKLTVLAHPTSQPYQTDVQDRTDLGADAVAAVPARLNVDARPGLVYMARGQTTPSVLLPRATLNISVNLNDGNAPGGNSDPTPVGGACNGSNTCSLREAIIKVNTSGAGTYNISVPAGTYTLKLPRVAGTEDASTGTLDIGVTDVTQTVNIMGGGQATTIIQAGTVGGSAGNGVDKVFSFNQDINAFSDSTVTLSSLTIQNGFNRGDYHAIFDGSGGAFDCDTGVNGGDSVMLTNVTLNNNFVSDGEGGGFTTFNDVHPSTGLVTVTNSIISNNSVSNSSPDFGDGGGILVADSASLTMTNTTVSGNKTKSDEGGGGISDAGSGLDETGANFINNQVTLHGVTITNNTAGTLGGGLLSNGGGLTIDQESVISNNSATGDGGGMQVGIYSNNNFAPFTVTFSNITVAGNHTSGTQGTGFGGGIKINGGLSGRNDFTMNYSRLSGNSGTSAEGQQFSWQGLSGAAIGITDNWWGTNADPTTGVNPPIKIDTTGTTAGTLNYSPWIVFTFSAGASSIKINTTTTLTADVAHDSNGSTTGLSGHLAVFNGLPVTFSSGSGGSITTTQPVDFTGGTGSVTSTFQAGGSGASVTASATFDGVTLNTNILVLQPPSMTMSFSPIMVKPNVVSTLTYNITNGNIVPFDANFSNSLPTGLQVASTPAVNNGCGGSVTASAGATSISFSNASLPVGTCSITVNVIGTVDNTYTDSTTINSTSASGNGNTPSANLTVINPPTLVKSFAPASVPLNGTTTMTITVSSTNTNLSLTSVGFVDTLPSGLVVASPSNLNSNCSGMAAAGANVNMSGSTLSAGTNCVVTVTMKGTTAGTLVNSVLPTSGNGGNGTNGNATLTVIAPPAIGKSFGAASVALNTNTSLSFTVSNPNSSTNTSLSNVGFTDNLPAGLTVASPSNGLTGSCGAGTISATAGGTAVSLSGATLAGSGGGSSCTFSVNVTGTGAGTMNNLTTAVTSTEGGNGLTASASIFVVAPPSMTAAFAPGSIGLNSSSVLTFTITNPSGNTTSLTGVGFSDTLPAGLTVTNGTSSVCGGANNLTLSGANTITLTGSTIAANGQCQFNVSVTGATAGSYTVTTGAVNSTNGGMGNTAQAGLTVVLPATISEAFGAAAIPLNNGGTTLTFTLGNPSANTGIALTGVQFTDTLPAGLTVAGTPGVSNTCGGTVTALAASGTVSLSGGSLAIGGTCTVVVNVTGTTAGVKVNSVQVSSTNGGTNPTAGTASLTVVAPPAISEVFGTGSIPLNAPSNTTTLTFTITNPAVNVGNSIALAGVAFTDNLTNGLQIADTNVTNTCGGTLTGATAGSTSIVLSAGSVGVSPATCIVTVDVTGTTAVTVSNSVSASSTNGGSGGATGSASLAVVAPPQIGKQFGASNVSPGGTTALTFTITNPAANTVALGGVAFTDTLTSGLQVAASSPVVSNTCGGTLTANPNATSIVLANGSVTVSPNTCAIVVNVTATQPGPVSNSVTISSTNGGIGNTANAALSSVSPPTISEAFGAAAIPFNSSTTLTFTLGNPAANTMTTLSGVQFTDTLPAGLTVAGTPGVSNTCGGTVTALAASGTVSLSGGSLAIGGTCTVVVNVTGTTAGVKVNSVQVSSTNGGTNPTAGTASLTVVAPPAISEVFGTGSIPLNAPSNTTTLTFTITNPAVNVGNSIALAGVAFTDNLTNGLQIADTNVTNTCGGTLTGATAGSTSIVLSAGSVGVSPATCIVTVDVTGTTAGTVSNSVSASSTNGGSGGATGSASLAVVAPPQIGKQFGASNVSPGGTTALTFTITNPAANTVALGGVAFTDTLTSGLQVAASSPVVSNTCGGTLTANPNATSIVLANGSVTVSPNTCAIVVNVTATQPGPVSNSVTISSTNGGIGNTANAALSSVSPPTISEAFGAAAIPFNSSTTLTFTLGNPAANTMTTLSGVQFTDTLPAGLTVAGTPGVSNTCGGTVTALAASGTVSLSGGSLAIGGTCTVVVNVTGVTTGVKSNSVQVSSTNGGAGNTASAGLTVSFTDVSSLVSVTQTGFGRNRATGLWSGTMTVTNISGTAISSPIEVVLTALSSTATMVNNSGFYNGAPYANSPYVTVLPAGMLAPGASVNVLIQFQNPTNGFINFTPVTFAGGLF